MRVTRAQKGDGYTIAASVDELRMLATGMTEFTPAPEERALARKMLQLLITALPVVEEDDDSDDDDLYDDAPAKSGANGSDDDDDL